MFTDSVSSTLSIWTSLNSWFTPTVLFVVLNLVIGIIAIASNLGGPQRPHQRHPSDPDHPQYLHRSPSVLQRLKSMNPYAYRSEEPATVFEKPPGTDAHYANYEHPQLVRPPSVLQRFKFSFSVYKPEESFQSPPPATSFEKSPGIDTHSANYQHPQLVRSPSVLQRLKLSFSGYKPEDSFQSPSPVTLSEKPPGVDSHYANFEHPQLKVEEVQIRRRKDESKRVEEEEYEDMDGGHEPTMDEVYSKLHGDHFNRTKSDTMPTAGEFPTKLPRKMKKSASSKSAFSHFEAGEIVENRRPATVKEGREKMTEIDDEVDARADDFINKFKQQLKLQRLESILKYKEMVGRGNAK
ncbi:pathogen-associated molecular patterns-induced protein A70 [Benincasa hispida]|uniref:pathogen-associated molecular patterns-induced protein A70 n=1 Tax=Benincasa hispida TaxID=102211 RepID=UPI001901D650|nr:pathogen-associated molecular patterns-induced protein A70 [Benincasa hispida]